MPHYTVIVLVILIGLLVVYLGASPGSGFLGIVQLFVNLFVYRHSQRGVIVEQIVIA